MPIFKTLGLRPFSVDTLNMIQVVCRVALALSALGLFTRVSMLVASHGGPSRILTRRWIKRSPELGGWPWIVETSLSSMAASLLVRQQPDEADLDCMD